MAKGIIVDDSVMMRMQIERRLGPQHEIIAFGENGEDAYELYKKHQPDFMTLDISMPEVDGLAALERIAREFPNPRIIIVSAVGQQRNVLKAGMLGVRSFVVKPVKEHALTEAVAKVLATEPVVS